MKNFAYYNYDKTDLHISGSVWLTEMGLIETQWFLDTKWLITRTAYHKWIISCYE